jgi:hypothetical protein
MPHVHSMCRHMRRRDPSLPLFENTPVPGNVLFEGRNNFLQLSTPPVTLSLCSKVLELRTTIAHCAVDAIVELNIDPCPIVDMDLIYERP